MYKMLLFFNPSFLYSISLHAPQTFAQYCTYMQYVPLYATLQCTLCAVGVITGVLAQISVGGFMKSLHWL